MTQLNCWLRLAEVGNVQLKRLAIQRRAVLNPAIAGGGLKGVNALGSIEVMIAAHNGDGAALLKEAGADGADAASIVVADGIEGNAIDEGEDGRIEADADGKNEHRGCPEGAGAAKLPQRIREALYPKGDEAHFS
jgi:hypothetical protein